MHHDQFVKAYKNKEIKVLVNKKLASKTLHSQLGKKEFRIATFFFDILSYLLMFVASLTILFFYSWELALISFAIGFLIQKANMRTAEEFIVKNALEDKYFYDYCIEKNAIEIRGNTSEVIQDHKIENVLDLMTAPEKEQLKAGYFPQRLIDAANKQGVIIKDIYKYVQITSKAQ